MRTIFLASAAALTLGCGATALTAQDMGTAATVAVATALTLDQQAMYHGWPADQRTSYDTWPAPYQTYFWTITPNQQTAWWRLNTEQRMQLYEMTPEQRMVAWNSIEAQVYAAPPAVVQVQANPVGSSAAPTATPPNPPVAAAPVPPAMPADPSYNAGPYKGALTAPPAEAMNRVYPVCTRTLRDSCRNPGGK
ncbi:MAG TPA: hypothetical protein VHG29_09220 [Novosphingobium sp.]|nr:hypothetical protein [Novosphingobium sp.]